MNKLVDSVRSYANKFNLGYLAAGVFFIIVGISTSITGKLPRGGVIYDDNLKIFYGIIWLVLGLACVFVGVRKK